MEGTLRLIAVLLVLSGCDSTPATSGGELDAGGGAPDAQLPADAAVGEDAGQGTDGGAADGSLPWSGDGGCPLKANGEQCGGDGECCSGSCLGGLCTTGAGACFGLGHTCTANVECCGGNLCAPDAAGGKRCSDQQFCGADGASCTRADQCCSLTCGACGAAGCVCGGGELCKPASEPCAAPSECCSNLCSGGTCQSSGAGCATFGESCALAGTSSTCCSRLCGDLDGELRCVASSSCRARGEICALDTDCCSGTCLDGRCPSQNQLGQKLFVGEPCAADSECASYACASSYPGGPKSCQFLGGCRPAEEVCHEDWECCGYLELSAGRDQCLTPLEMPGTCSQLPGLPNLSRCTLQQTAKEIGEICESGGQKVHDCCGGPEVCQPTVTGVSRCLGGGFAGDGDAGFACAADGDSCSVPEQCCSGTCAPVATFEGVVTLRCSGCVDAGGLCTTGSDCCGRSCVAGSCAEPASPDAGTACAPLGAGCAGSADCCSAICSLGLCRTCHAAGDSCGGNADCCAGSCLDGSCACQAEGTLCGADTQCCSQICSNGACRLCRMTGDGCSANADCCGQLCDIPDGGSSGLCRSIIN